MFRFITTILIATFLFSCSTQNPNPNNSNNNSVTDVDGNVYPTVQICNQVWTAKNLNVSHYRNGDVIPHITNLNDWFFSTNGGWCWYNNDSANYSQYGKLYNCYAVMDSRGLAPSGFHIPTDAEWGILVSCLGGSSMAGGALKETGFTHWNGPNIGATNSSGFNAFAAGYNVGNAFADNGIRCYWWSTDHDGAGHASLWGCYYYNANMGKAMLSQNVGASVRLIKD